MKQKNLKTVSVVSFLILLIAFAFVTGAWSTRHIMKGGKRLSQPIGSLVLFSSQIPSQVKSFVSLAENFKAPIGLSNNYSNIHEAGMHESRLDGFILISCIDQDGLNQVGLINLATRKYNQLSIQQLRGNNERYSDILHGADGKRQISFSSRHRIWHPYLDSEGNLTYIIQGNDLVSLDLKTGKKRWSVKGAFHHSIETDSDGNFWACGSIKPNSKDDSFKMINHSNYEFDDQALVKISKEGKILRVLSVSNLLCNSGLEFLLYGISNPDLNSDPLHLNQITPIVNTQGVFKRGQILVSLRNMSTIILVDVQTDKVVWHQTGPWMNQHCVVPIRDSSFALLDNHSFASGEYWLNQHWRTRVLTHNISSGKTEEILLNSQLAEGFRVAIEGRVFPLSNDAWLIEDSVQGTVLVVHDGKIVLKWQNLYKNGNVGPTSWCRYIEKSQMPQRLLTDTPRRSTDYFVTPNDLDSSLF